MMTDEVVNVWHYWRWQCDLVSGWWWCSGPGYGKSSLSQPFASVAFLLLRQSVGEAKERKWFWKWNMTCHFFVFAAHFTKGPVMLARTHMGTLCLLYVILCIQCVCNSPPLPVKENLCKCVILLAIATLFSSGVCVCVSCLIKVNPCEAAGAPLLCVPHPSLSFLHSSTLLSLHPCSPSSWHSDSTGEYAPSRSHPPFLAPAGGVSLETVSELTGWVQIDGCPLSDYTTGPLKATRLDLWAWSHPSVLTRNGPFHLTRVNISSTQAEGVCVCVCVCVYVLFFSVYIYWMSVSLAAYVQCVCVCVCACVCVTDGKYLSLNWAYLGRNSVQVSSFLCVLGRETKWRLVFFLLCLPSSQNDVPKKPRSLHS